MENRILRQLYELYGKEIYLYLYSLCHSHSIAEDLRQETFVKAILSLPENHANTRAWFYMVARNLCFSYMKKEKRLLPLEDEAGKLWLSDDKPDALELIIREEHIRALYQALAKLTQPKREVLTLQYFGGLSQREIAAVLGLSPENVRVLSYRAKRDLKSYMEENGYDIS